MHGQGAKRAAIMTMDKVRYFSRRILCRLLCVSKWHASGFSRHPYRAAIANHIRMTRPDSVLEIGSGFGDIICNLSAATLWATDRSPRVLAGARLCHPVDSLTGRVRFSPLQLGEDPGRQFDTVICVNFIHGIPPDILRDYFVELMARTIPPGGSLIFDVVDDPSYRFRHDPAFLLRGIPVRQKKIDGFPYGRSIVVAQRDDCRETAGGAASRAWPEGRPCRERTQICKPCESQR
jgi:hypothetical protein